MDVIFDAFPSTGAHHETTLGKPRSVKEACLRCHSMHRKCSGDFPCERCMRLGAKCVFPSRKKLQKYNWNAEEIIRDLQSQLDLYKARVFSTEIRLSEIQ